MADNKYGRVFTTSDVETILEAVFRKDAPDEWWDDHGSPQFDIILEDLDDMNARFKFDPDEPLFILRGRDKRAAGPIKHYQDHQARTAPNNHMAAIGKALQAFTDYRNANAEKMKEPD